MADDAKPGTAGRGRLLLWGCIAGGVFSLALLVYRVASQPEPAAPRPPELGGQQVPDAVYELRFDRPYDLFCSFYSDEPTIYRNCKILGFTGRGEESSQSGRATGSGSFSVLSGAGSSSYSREYFDHWLVLELADGRLAYIPPSAVKYIEDAADADE